MKIEKTNKELSANYIKLLQDTDREKLFVIYTDKEDRAIIVTYYTWSIERRQYYSSQILIMAQKTKASKVIIIHYQSNGNIIPTKEDKQIATDIWTSLNMHNLELRDYIINAGEHRYYSMADNRYLTKGRKDDTTKI